MGLILAVVIAARTPTVLPEVPVLHHSPDPKKPTHMLRYPQLIEGRKMVGCKCHSRPVHLRKCCPGETLLVGQEGAQLGTKDGMTNCLRWVGGDLGAINCAAPALMSNRRRACGSRRKVVKGQQTVLGKPIHFHIHLSHAGKRLIGAEVILVAIYVSKVDTDRELSLEDMDGSNKIQMGSRQGYLCPVEIALSDATQVIATQGDTAGGDVVEGTKG
jgi:hypothetical protein